MDVCTTDEPVITEVGRLTVRCHLMNPTGYQTPGPSSPGQE
jgi:hypothetical protein